jgi:hypothetical protein
MGRAARRYVAEQHTLEGAASGYLTFLADLLGQPAPVADLVPLPYHDDMPTVPDPAFSPPLKAPAPPALVAAPPASPPVPPPTPEPAPATTPLATLAAAAADCGVAPDDPLLPALLRRVDGLL